MECMQQAITSNLKEEHHQPCSCLCASCSAGCCANLKDTMSSFMKHLFCEPSHSLSGTTMFYSWECLSFDCDVCWKEKDYLIFNCPLSSWNSETGKYKFISNAFVFWIYSLIYYWLIYVCRINIMAKIYWCWPYHKQSHSCCWFGRPCPTLWSSNHVQQNQAFLTCEYLQNGFSPRFSTVGKVDIPTSPIGKDSKRKL